MDELAVVGSVVLTENGLELPPGLDYDRWADIGHHLRELAARTERARSAISWAIGQWLAYGQHTYGEKYAQAAELCGLAPQTLMNMQYVTERYGGAPSHPNLPFGHHQEAASLPVELRERLLDEAEAEGLTTAEVRARRRALTATANGEHEHEAEAKYQLTQALQELRRLPPDRWPSLLYWAIKPMTRAPGFTDGLIDLLTTGQ